MSHCAGHLYGFGGDIWAARRRSAMALNLWESKALQLLAAGLLLFYVWMDVALYYQVQASILINSKHSLQPPFAALFTKPAIKRTGIPLSVHRVQTAQRKCDEKREHELNVCQKNHSVCL